MSVAIHYQLSGQGTPLLFIHGLGGDSVQLRELFEPIRMVQKIFPDLPGHGQSVLQESQEISFSSYAGHIVSLLDHLKIEEAIIGGLSMGAGITTRLMQDCPDRVKAAILLRPAWLDKASPLNLQLLGQVADFVVQANGKTSFQQLEAFQELAEQLPLLAQSLLGQFDRPQGPALTAKVLRSLIDDRPLQKLDALQGFTKACLILANESDPLHPVAFAKALHRCLKGSEIHQVYPRYLDPERHNARVQKKMQDFLQRHI